MTLPPKISLEVEEEMAPDSEDYRQLEKELAMVRLSRLSILCFSLGFPHIFVLTFTYKLVPGTPYAVSLHLYTLVFTYTRTAFIAPFAHLRYLQLYWCLF